MQTVVTQRHSSAPLENDQRALEEDLLQNSA